ncbi:conserved hypothetical protein [Rhodopseudomonas palustris HaA2]|uniref:Transmembrane protein n=1 Tax=Rhodopseudomonas palustris (strain HaA2) TaxID=316058 RepID=Q2J3H6_RHOP2|nr:hypothetical protein [Rhodopseudomonas palustris]ABD04984.1 conserved hypothetical protein [Rhodopseudomonas palustris HaA2]
MKRRLLQPLWFILAVLFLVEAWLWEHLEPWVERIVAALPLRELKAWTAERVAHLSPPLALVVFAVPLIPLYPFKLFALWLMATQHFIAGLLAFVLAQFVGLGLIAFIFDVTKPKLMQMAWFVRAYQFVLAIKAKAHAIVAPVMAAIRARISALIGEGDGPMQRLLRKAMQVRKRIRASR